VEKSQAQSTGSFLHHGELTIQLPGVPVDATQYLKLCRYAGNPGAHFEYITQRWTRTFRLKKPIRIKVVGKIISRILISEERVGLVDVIGVVARNPFYRKKSLPKEFNSDVFSFVELTETETLVCSLRDWHGENHLVDHYHLLGFDVTRASAEQIIRPFCTWNRILNLK
jgi:hypothetical protein